MGRCVEEVLPDGNLRTLVYDADGNNVAEHVGAPGTAFAPRPSGSRGGWRTREYGSWYLLTADATPLGNVTRFDYTHHGAWRAVTDPNGNRTEYVRDQRHRVTEIHRYGGVFRRYRYDASNTVVEEQDRNGQTLIAYDNDARGQHLTKKLLSGESYEYEYDRHGRCTRAASSLHDVRQARVGLKLALDQRDGKGVEHEYDERKRLKESVIFGRFKIQLSYLSDARVRIQTPDGTTHIFRQHQHCVVRENGNGTTEALTFDEAERLTARACWRESDDAHTPFWHARYKYTSTGELLENTDLQRAATYEYDADGRIAAEHGQNGERRYTYDPAGNLLSTPRVRALRYLDGNLLSSADFEHFRYDDRRRLALRNHTHGNVTEYIYDSQNQLTGARIDGELVWRASYDGLGRRLWREYRGERTDFYWDADRLAAERSPDGRLRVYVYPNEDALVPFMWLDYANDDAPATAARVSYLYTAPNGMPLRVEDSEGAEIWRASAVDAYGEIAADTECPTRLRFAGHFYDEHLGLFYNRFRDYDPKLGCYLQPDPLGHGGGPNLFAYTRNPLADVDLRGLTIHKVPDSPKPHGADGSGHPDGEASDHPKPRPKGKETDLVDEHGRPKKPLKDMTDEELKDFTKQRAQQINDAQHPQEAKRTTTAVTVVETPPGNKDSRKVVVTSSENREPKMPNKVGGEEVHPKGSPRDSALNSDEEFRKTPPALSKQGTVDGPNGPEPVDHTGKPGKQRDYFDENGEPYKKADTSNPEGGGETRHHAEQRAQTSTESTSDGKPREPKEGVAAMSPTKPCCPGCREALGKSGNLGKVPSDLQGG